MIILDKRNESRNVFDDLSTKICFPSKTNGIDVEVFNMITRINKVKTLMKHTSCDCKYKFNSTT